MSKLYDWLFSTRCSHCNTMLIHQKVYVAREPSTSGVGNVISYTEPKLYNAVDCPLCGKQTILGRYYSKELDNE